MLMKLTPAHQLVRRERFLDFLIQTLSSESPNCVDSPLWSDAWKQPTCQPCFWRRSQFLWTTCQYFFEAGWWGLVDRNDDSCEQSSRSGIDFSNILQAAYDRRDPKSAKRYWWRDCLYALMCIKGVCEHVSEIDCCSQFHQQLIYKQLLRQSFGKK